MLNENGCNCWVFVFLVTYNLLSTLHFLHIDHFFLWYAISTHPVGLNRKSPNTIEWLIITLFNPSLKYFLANAKRCINCLLRPSMLTIWTKVQIQIQIDQKWLFNSHLKTELKTNVYTHWISKITTRLSRLGYTSITLILSVIIFTQIYRYAAFDHYWLLQHSFSIWLVKIHKPILRWKSLYTFWDVALVKTSITWLTLFT